jgi:hypothetical protein
MATMKQKERKDISINTRYPPEVLEAMRALAQEHQRSFNGEVIWALRSYLDAQKGKKPREKSI